MTEAQKCFAVLARAQQDAAASSARLAQMFLAISQDPALAEAKLQVWQTNERERKRAAAERRKKAKAA